MKCLVTLPDKSTRHVTADSVQEAARIMQANGEHIEGAMIRQDAVVANTRKLLEERHNKIFERGSFDAT